MPPIITKHTTRHSDIYIEGSFHKRSIDTLSLQVHCDNLRRNGVNYLVINPDNVVTTAY